MTAVGSTLKERRNWPASLVEHHDDSGRPVRGLVGVGDRILSSLEDPRVISESFSGALETFVDGKPSAVVGACGESATHKHG